MYTNSKTHAYLYGTLYTVYIYIYVCVCVSMLICVFYLSLSLLFSFLSSLPFFLPLHILSCPKSHAMAQWGTNFQERMHFNTANRGTGRDDLAPICRKQGQLLFVLASRVSHDVGMERHEAVARQASKNLCSREGCRSILASFQEGSL